MEGFLHSMLGMNKITNASDQERSDTHLKVKQMNQNRQAQNRYKPDPHRKNIFEDKGYFYKRCSELENKIKKLERANKYLIQQVIDTMSMRNFVDSRKNSNTNFQLETGVSVDSGSGGSNSNNNHQSNMRKNVKNSLIFST